MPGLLKVSMTFNLSSLFSSFRGQGQLEWWVHLTQTLQSAWICFTPPSLGL